MTILGQEISAFITCMKNNANEGAQTCRADCQLAMIKAIDLNASQQSQPLQQYTDWEISRFSTKSRANLSLTNISLFIGLRRLDFIHLQCFCSMRRGITELIDFRISSRY